MFFFKLCPRCGGDLFRQSDIYGSYIGCLQCGYVLRPEDELRLTRELLRPSTVRTSTPASKAA
jgi:hypothetical protein